MSVQKGFTGILILIVGVLIIATLGIYIFSTSKTSPINEVKTVTTPEETVKTYTNDVLGFSFKHDKDLSVIEDSEEEFNKRSAGATSKSPTGDYRKNFSSYVGYSPEKFLGAVVVLEKQDFDKSPLFIWVFENPNNLSPENWYKRYWYYPFIWGDFTTRANEAAPTKDATISGQLAKYSIVDYQPNSPKFIYLSKKEKMFLFRIIGEKGEQLLNTFKFTN